MNERSEEALRERIDETRARLGDTIEQIGDRVNPDRVKADLKARAREQVDDMKNNMKRKARNTMRNVEHGVTDTGRGIWATIRENPVPAGMIGVGLAWLMKNRRNADEQRYSAHRFTQRVDAYGAEPYRAGYAEPSYDESYVATGRSEIAYGDRFDAQGGVGFTGPRGATQASGDGTQDERGLRAKASEVVHHATDRMSEVKDRVGSAAHGAQDRVSRLAHDAKDRARDAERRIESSLHDNPVAAGAMALAIGMAAGLMIPESEREHQLLGRSRDRVLDKAQEAARRAADKLHESAREAAGESARHMVDEVWPHSDEDSGAEGISEPRR